MIKLRFLSSNEFKIREAMEILKRVGIEVVPVKFKITELQTNDIDLLTKDKALKAFKQIGRALFVEHTGLFLNYLNGLPGGLTQLFWDTLQADRFSELFGRSSDPNVKAKTVIAYCDGKQIYFFRGEIEGKISSSPRGKRDFQWDCVFIPNGFKETFAELGVRKNEISMRRKALDELAKFLKEKSR
jgi:XTP/dITP diphosphohydrolase